MHMGSVTGNAEGKLQEVDRKGASCRSGRGKKASCRKWTEKGASCRS